MPQIHLIRPPFGVLLALALAAPSAAIAYDNQDAIRACESRIGQEYGLTDLREGHAVQQPGEKNYRVEGKTKVDGEKYPWTCEIRNRRVVDVDYRGRRPSRADSGIADVMPRRSGEVEVRMPGGCTALYDREGELIARSRECSASDRRRADDAVAAYFRAPGTSRDRDWRNGGYGGYDGYGDGRSQLDIGLSENGNGRVRFADGCTVYYRNGRREAASDACRNRQLDAADEAVDDRHYDRH